MARMLLHPLVSFGALRIVPMDMFSQLLISVRYSEDSDRPKLLDLWSERVSRLRVLIG